MLFQSLGRKIPWRRKRQPTPVFLPGESHEQRSLVGYSLWGRQLSDGVLMHAHGHTHTHHTLSKFQGYQQPWWCQPSKKRSEV